MKISSSIGAFLLITSVVINSGCNKDEPTPSEHPFKSLESVRDTVAYFDIPGTVARDGSQFGIGVRLSDKNRWVIYLQGGGACYNGVTCLINETNFNREKFFSSNLDGALKTAGIFNIIDDRNPLKDWSAVYVPYCSGDVHSGNRKDAEIYGVSGKQQFLGFNNTKKIFEYLAPYLKENNVEHIVFCGLSAGGYGVNLNITSLVKIFPRVKITVIDDSGPIFAGDQVFSPCLDSSFRSIFNLPLPDDLLNCCGTPELRLANMYEYSSSSRFNNVNYGLYSTFEDENIRLMLGFGYNKCAPPFIGFRIPGSEYTDALIDLRENIIKPKSSWSTFYNSGDVHGILFGDLYLSEKAGDMYFYEWIDALVNGAKSLHISD